MGNIEIYDFNKRFKPDQKWISFLSDLDTTNIRSRSLKRYIRLTNDPDSIKFDKSQQSGLLLAPIIYSKDGEKAFAVTSMMSKNGGSFIWLFENNSGNWKIIFR
jgi:hypothetical protein